MIVLGIDPGTHRMGFGLVERVAGKPHLIKAGLLVEDRSLQGDLSTIKDRVDTLIRTYRPDTLAIEKLFFSKNKKTALSVAEARGIVVLSAKEHGVAIKEYSPTQVKVAVTGYGRADKSAVFKMVKMILGDPKLELGDDAADAVAVAIAACNSLGH